MKADSGQNNLLAYRTKVGNIVPKSFKFNQAIRILNRRVTTIFDLTDVMKALLKLFKIIIRCRRL